MTSKRPKVRSTTNIRGESEFFQNLEVGTMLENLLSYDDGDEEILSQSALRSLETEKMVEQEKRASSVVMFLGVRFQSYDVTFQLAFSFSQFSNSQFSNIYNNNQAS